MDPTQVVFIIIALLVILYGVIVFVGSVARWLGSSALITSSTAVRESQQITVAPPVAQTAIRSVAPIATAHNASNEALHVAETAKLETIAALIAESKRKRFHDGEVPETRALEAVFGVKPSSEPTSNYQRLRLLLKDELARLNPPAPTQPIYRPLDEQHRPVLKDEPVETA